MKEKYVYHQAKVGAEGGSVESERISLINRIGRAKKKRGENVERKGGSF